MFRYLSSCTQGWPKKLLLGCVNPSFGQLFMNTNTKSLPVAQEMLVREVSVRVFERGLQDVTVASMLFFDVILLLSLLDFTQDYRKSA